MKGFLKKIGVFMCASTTFFWPIALAGCSDKSEKVDDKLGATNSVSSLILATDMFVLVDDVLHKGDVYGCVAGSFTGLGVTVLDLDCDEYIMTNDFKAYKNKEPKKELYETKCEKCFEK